MRLSTNEIDVFTVQHNNVARNYLYSTNCTLSLNSQGSITGNV